MPKQTNTAPTGKWVIQRTKDYRYLSCVRDGEPTEWTHSKRNAMEWLSEEDAKVEVTWHLQNDPYWREDVRVVFVPDKGAEVAKASCPSVGQDRMNEATVQVTLTLAEAVLVIAALQARVKKDTEAIETSPMPDLHVVLQQRAKGIIRRLEKEIVP